MTSLPELRARAERPIVYPLNRDECLLLVDIAEAAQAWKNARDRAIECHDEFGVDRYVACGEWQDAEDAAADALAAALSRLGCAPTRRSGCARSRRTSAISSPSSTS